MAKKMEDKTLSPPGTLEFGPELLLTPLWKPPLIRRSARE